jgi:hypothetical protein
MASALDHGHISEISGSKLLKEQCLALLDYPGRRTAYRQELGRIGQRGSSPLWFPDGAATRLPERTYLYPSPGGRLSAPPYRVRIPADQADQIVVEWTYGESYRQEIEVIWRTSCAVGPRLLCPHCGARTQYLYVEKDKVGCLKSHLRGRGCVGGAVAGPSQRIAVMPTQDLPKEAADTLNLLELLGDPYRRPPGVHSTDWRRKRAEFDQALLELNRALLIRRYDLIWKRVPHDE